MLTHEARITWKTDYSAEVEILGVCIPVDAVTAMRLAKRSVAYEAKLALAECALTQSDYAQCSKLIDEIESEFNCVSDKRIIGLRWELHDTMLYGPIDG